MKRKLTSTEKIRRYMAKVPYAKPKEIAAALDIPISTVYVSRNALKKNGKLPTAKPKARTQQQATPDLVNQPPHYTVGGIETITYLKAKLTPEEFRGYLKGNVLKYASRANHKDNPKQDIDKMVWYANALQEAA
jgi:hypothetical protein